LKAHLIEAPAADDPALAALDRSFTDAVTHGDKDAALKLLDDDATWTDANGRTLARAAIAQGLPTPAIAEADAAQVHRYTYGPVGVVQSDRDSVHQLHVWVQRSSGWKLLLHHEVRSLDAPPTVTPGTGKECVNPCKTVPYEPKSESERGVIAAYQELETASHAADVKNWGTHIADEFVVASSNSDKVLDKQARIAGLARGTFGGVAPTSLVSAQMFDFGDVVVMRSQHKPERGALLQIARVWVKRNGVWQSTLSYQTAIRDAARTTE
jgi:hypothetical protein